MTERNPAWNNKLILIIIIFFSLNVPFILFSFTVKSPALLLPDNETIQVNDICGVCHMGSDDPNSQEYINMKTLGASWTRVDFHWKGIQPDSSTWNWVYWDAFLDAADQNNISVLALLVFDNDNVETVKTGTRYIHPNDFPLFLEYVDRTIRRYRNRVGAWEIWNEPNTDRFWDGPIEDFYNLFNQTINLIHEIELEYNQDIIVLSSAPTGASSLFIPDIIEVLFSKGLMEYIDACAFHVYTYDADSLYQYLMQVRAIGKKYDFKGEYWITEIGNPTGGQYPHRVSQERLAENVIKNHIICTAYGIERVIWYHDTDSKHPDPNDSEGYFGLLYGDNSWKPGAHAYRLFTEYCVNSIYTTTPIKKIGGLSSNDLKVALYCKSGGTHALIIWNDPSIYANGTVQVTITLPENTINIQAHDIYTGNAEYLTEFTLDVGQKPIFLTFECSEPIESITILMSDPLIFIVLYSLILATLTLSLIYSVKIYIKDYYKKERKHFRI